MMAICTEAASQRAAAAPSLEHAGAVAGREPSPAGSTFRRSTVGPSRRAVPLRPVTSKHARRTHSMEVRGERRVFGKNARGQHEGRSPLKESKLLHAKKNGAPDPLTSSFADETRPSRPRGKRRETGSSPLRKVRPKSESAVRNTLGCLSDSHAISFSVGLTSNEHPVFS